MTDTKRFVFAYEQYDSPDRESSEFPIRTASTVTHDFDVDCTWDTILSQFLNFLSGIYGYDISESVSFETLEDKIRRIETEQFWQE